MTDHTPTVADRGGSRTENDGLAVQAGGLSPVIYLGRLDRSGRAFQTKRDATAEVMHAVAEYVRTHLHGDAWVNVGDYRLDITVTAREKTDA